jgi:ParB-like chromosome segregation protein Spo0J
VPQDNVQANDYNPNVVAPPQKRTLRKSIQKSGFTQPIVSWPTDPGQFEVVDGFHRNLVARETPALRKRLHGRLPVTVIRSDRRDRAARIETTIVHNEARGRHTIQGEEDVVLELSRLGKSDEYIADELGMDPDKVLRLKQQAGLAALYTEDEFSEAFEVDTDDPFAAAGPDTDVPEES